MNTKHTPGKWEAQSRSMSDGALVVKDSKFDEICVIRESKDRHEGPDNDRDIANAKLIAAAPDLLAALQAALDAMVAADCGTVTVVPKLSAALSRAGAA